MPIKIAKPHQQNMDQQYAAPIASASCWMNKRNKTSVCRFYCEVTDSWTIDRLSHKIAKIWYIYQVSIIIHRAEKISKLSGFWGNFDFLKSWISAVQFLKWKVCSVLLLGKQINSLEKSDFSPASKWAQLREELTLAETFLLRISHFIFRDKYLHPSWRISMGGVKTLCGWKVQENPKPVV